MLHENITTVRKSKGLSQDELATKLAVVRQTVSKWERGLSVPDASMLLALSEVLETPVSTLLGESIAESKANDMQVIAEKLEVINLQLAQRREARRKTVQWLLLALWLAVGGAFVVILLVRSPYLAWDYTAPETAVMGVLLHAAEWAFVRLAPIVLVGLTIGIVMLHKRNSQ